MSDKLCPECGHESAAHEIKGCFARVDGAPFGRCTCRCIPREIELMAERDEARAEIRRMRLLILQGNIIDTPMVDDGFGSRAFAWCSECGGDVRAERPGVFRCGECRQ